MKKLFCIFALLFSLFTLSSCFLWRSTEYPDMVEYTEEEVLSVVKEKYDIAEWIFTSMELHGEALYDVYGNFKIENGSSQFSTDFINGDNTEAAMTAFAGKRGGHDIQGMYRWFLSYVALGECSDGTLKYVYYNTNIHKNAEIADTVGASNYTFEVLPTEINDSLFTVPTEWNDMTAYMNKNFKGLSPAELNYSGECLMRSYDDQRLGRIDAEFYKENGKVVYDLYYTKDRTNPDERRLVYSSSDRYGVIYNYYGVDKSQYFDITQTVEQSIDEQNTMVLWGYVKTKKIDGTVLYSNINYRAEYQVLRDGEIILSNSSDSVIDKLNFERGYGIDKIDGVDHTETAKFFVSDFYIFYEKSTETE